MAMNLCLAGSDGASPQGYSITFEMLSQKVVSGDKEAVTRYLGEKSPVNKKSVSFKEEKKGKVCG